MLAGLLVAAGLSAAGVSVHLGPVTLGFQVDPPSKKWADELAPKLKKVEDGFKAKRSALRLAPSRDGKPALFREDVRELIAGTSAELDQAIVGVQPVELDALRHWSTNELARLQAKLGGPSGPQAALRPAGRFTPRAIARVASLGGFPLLRLAGATAPPQDTVAADEANRLLDKALEVVSRIFVLASTDNLEVKLWVGSTAQRATFSFWSEGEIKGATRAPKIIQTNGKLEHVLRGEYLYKATWTQGAVTQLIQYPSLAGNSASPIESERLDLVNGSSFFCCHFNEQYCRHVDNEKDCHS